MIMRYKNICPENCICYSRIYFIISMAQMIQKKRVSLKNVPLIGFLIVEINEINYCKKVNKLIYRFTSQDLVTSSNKNYNPCPTKNTLEQI